MRETPLAEGSTGNRRKTLPLAYSDVRPVQVMQKNCVATETDVGGDNLFIPLTPD
jgi:hypothetical protein